MSIEDLDHLGEIGERAGQPVDLVDDDDVDPPGLDVGKQALQRRALQGGARDAAIVVTGGQRDPPLVLLAGDIGCAGLPLGLQRVEGLLEAFFRGFTWYRQDEKGPLSHTGDRVPGTSRKRCDTVVWHDSSQEGPEVIRMSQWAEVRQMHVVDGVPKKQIAERLGLDIKTVRRAVAQATTPARRAVSRPRHLDRWRAQIEQWLRQDRRLTAKRIRRLLLPLAGPVAERTVRWYVARLKAAAAPKEVYVHRSPRPGVTLEVDFGESWAEVAGVLRKVKYVVATLPYSNVYFAKAYPIERLESLLDGIQAAFAYMGGVTDRVVLDNTTIAVKQVLTGRDRVQTDAFQAFRGAYPFAAAFCAPAKGWEKGSVETGVKYVRNLVFRPRPTVANWAALNALIITELEADVATRRLADGRPVREAWTLERRHLRARPVHLPETCRVEARVVDKFGHVRADRVTYSVPTRYAYRPVWVKLYHDRVAVAAGTEVVARHVRAFRAGATVLDPLHVLPVLERKHRAVPEATALQNWPLAPLWQQVRTALRQQTRKPDQEWVRMLRLLETYPAPAVEAAVAAALARNSPRLETVRLLLRQRAAGPRPAIRPVPTVRADVARIAVPAPTLAAYDVLTGGRV